MDLKNKMKIIISISLLFAIFLSTATPNTIVEAASFKFSDYNYKDYIMPFSNSRQITLEDARQLAVYQLDLARNEIYARKGYMFKKKEYADYFTAKGWYKPDPSFKETSLTALEKKNATFLLNYSEKIKKNIKKPGVKSATVDLNQDGKKDIIKLNCTEDGYNFTLNVNGVSIKGKGDNLDGVFYICDINSADKYKEIAVTQSGPSDDYYTLFYWYDGKKLIYMGGTGGSDYSLLIDGSGILTTRTRGTILQTWFYSDSYKLDSKHLLVNIKKEYYLMNTNVTIKKSLSLQSSITNKKTSLVLKPGDKAVIISTDNKKWCKVMNSEGKTGWFYVNNYADINGTNMPASEYFDGLCYAD